jgi:hypothetical protein
MVKAGGAHPHSLTISTITYKVVVYAPAERADAHPLFPLYPICTQWGHPSPVSLRIQYIRNANQTYYILSREKGASGPKRMDRIEGT